MICILKIRRLSLIRIPKTSECVFKILWLIVISKKNKKRRFCSSYFKPEQNHKSESTINFRLIFSFDFISSSSSCRSSSLCVRLLLSHSFALSRYHIPSLRILSFSNFLSVILVVANHLEPFSNQNVCMTLLFLEYILFFKFTCCLFPFLPDFVVFSLVRSLVR